jgi:predicted O-methyltransferase YrrM
MLKKYTILLLLIINSQIDCSNPKLPTPYNTLNEILPFDLHGWFRESNQRMLTNFIKTYSPKIIIEVGVWCGKSAAYMAQIMPNNCMLYAVDHFKVDSEYSLMTPDIAARAARLYEQFLSNIIHLQLTDKIIPIRMNSLDAANTLEVLADIIYIDGSHEEEDVFNDVCAWTKKLNSNGIICGDDYDAPYVKRGVDKAAQLLGFTVLSDTCFWYILTNK